MKNTLLALLTAAIAGCSGGADWKQPDMNQKPIVLEEEVKKEITRPEAKPDVVTPKKDKPAYEPAEGYESIELEVAYKFDNGIAASTFEGYLKLLEKDKGREFNDYEKMQVAFKINKEGNITTKDISDVIATYSKEKNLKEVKIPAVEVEDDLRRVYTEKVAVTSEAIGDELLKLMEGKTDAQKARVAEAIRSVYNGKDPLTMKQVKKIQEYAKNN